MPPYEPPRLVTAVMRLTNAIARPRPDALMPNDDAGAYTDHDACRRADGSGAVLAPILDAALPRQLAARQSCRGPALPEQMARWRGAGAVPAPAALNLLALVRFSCAASTGACHYRGSRSPSRRRAVRRTWPGALKPNASPSDLRARLAGAGARRQVLVELPGGSPTAVVHGGRVVAFAAPSGSVADDLEPPRAAPWWFCRRRIDSAPPRPVPGSPGAAVAGTPRTGSAAAGEQFAPSGPAPRRRWPRGAGSPISCCRVGDAFLRAPRTRAVPVCRHPVVAGPAPTAASPSAERRAPPPVGARATRSVLADAALAAPRRDRPAGVRRVLGRPSNDGLGPALRPFFRFTGAREVWVAGLFERWAASPGTTTSCTCSSTRAGVRGSVSWERALPAKAGASCSVRGGSRPGVVAAQAACRRRSGSRPSAARVARVALSVVCASVAPRPLLDGPLQISCGAKASCYWRREGPSYARQHPAAIHHLPNLVTMFRVALVRSPFLLGTSPRSAAFIASCCTWGRAGDALYVTWRAAAAIQHAGQFLDPLADKLIVTAVLGFMVDLRRVPAWWWRAAGSRLRHNGCQRRLRSRPVIAPSTAARSSTALQLVAIMMR